MENRVNRSGFLSRLNRLVYILVLILFVLAGLSLAQNGSSGAGSVAISGIERSTLDCSGGLLLASYSTQQSPPPSQSLSGCIRIYDSGSVTININGFVEEVFYGQYSTASSIATALVNAFNGANNSPVSASLSGSTVYLTAKSVGANTNYPLSTYVDYDSDYFSSASFSAAPSGSTLTGGTNSGPSIGSISPASGPVGTSVTITGTNFGGTQGSSTVTFNGTTASPTSWNDTQIVAPVPSGATTGSIVITTAGGQATSSTFTVTVPAPTISSISPASGLIGTSVTITGTNFGGTQGSSTVTFNGTTASPASWSSTQIVTPVPSGATTGSIVVTTAGGQATSGTSFTVNTPSGLTVTNLSPSSGPVGTSVTITGTGFGASQGTSTVTFNGVAATPTSWADNSIVVPVPNGVPAGNATVAVNVGSQTSNSTFSVTPVIIRLALTTGPVQMGFVITGSNFGATQASSVVKIGATQMNVVSWSDTSIAVQVPTSATSGNVVVTVNGAASNGVNFSVVEPFSCK
jgi:IPT/TIG domain